jgi:uncharacterized membrane protein YbhN (UPF0104 family)
LSSRFSGYRAVIIGVLQLVCVAFVALVIWRRRADISAAFDLDATALVSLLILMLVSHVQRAWELTYLLRRLGVPEQFVEGFKLSGVSFLLNHLPLNAGLVVRAMVLRKEHALPYSSFLSLTMLNALINVAVSAACSIILLAVLVPHYETSVWTTMLVLGLVVSGSIGAIYLPRSTLVDRTSGGFVARQVRAMSSATATMRGNGGAVAVSAALALSKVAVLAIRLSICFDAVGSPVSPQLSCLLASTTLAMSVVNITPGNLGLRETMVGVVSAQLGTSLVFAMAAASIDRVVSLGYGVISGLPGLYSLQRRGSLLSRREPKETV